ncbi:MAG TPA: IS1182 family transposase [Clostridia bacterium]|nr:IS1182 family transposase [Clostridia bacterium]
MLEKKNGARELVEIICMEERVPRDYLLRKIDSAIDFSRIYDFVEDLYCKDNGRPSVDPVVLFKMVLIQHLYGIPSLRQTVRDIDMNIGYRWFLGYSLNEEIPHFATVSYNFRHRFTGETVEAVFRWILYEAERAGYLSPEMVFVDATHIKANANVNKKCKRGIPGAARQYEEQLRKEINAVREEHGQKPFDDDPPGAGGGAKVVTQSTTDPESGLFRKGEHKMCFAYGAHTVCDRNNFVLDVEVTAGNVHDSIVFDTVYRRVTERFPQVRVVTADAGYKTPWICTQVFDDGRLPSLPYRRPMTKEENHPWYEYVYDEYLDAVICPQYKTLSYATTNKDGYTEFRSKPYICKDCPTRYKCTQSKSCRKTVLRHVWEDYIERSEDVRHSPIGKASYALRSQTIERVFADAKEKHGMRYTQYRGLNPVSNWIKLKYAAMNLKKMALWRFKSLCAFAHSSLYCLLNMQNPAFIS